MSRHIFAAMSGGVDSSVVAHLLLRAGYDVTGATMTLYRPDGETGETQDVRDARAVCATLGIPHRVYDLGDAFCRAVIDDFVAVYEAGGTPNPCVVCNKHLKFGALLDAALRDSADGIATGHFARVARDPSGRYLLKKALDESKDQSYVLWQLSQDVLSHVLLPLGEMKKTDVRLLADGLGLVTAHKSDSQDICFVPDGDYAAFIRRYTGRVPEAGDYVDEEGRVLGRHKGLIHYTVGQRKGLGISLGAPMFVGAKDPATNRVTLTTNDRLFRRTIHLSDLNLIAADRLDDPIRAEVKIRYAHKASPATVIQTGEHTATVVFDEPQRAPAIGQSAVFYDGDTVIGGGIIVGDIVACDEV